MAAVLAAATAAGHAGSGRQGQLSIPGSSKTFQARYFRDDFRLAEYPYHAALQALVNGGTGAGSCYPVSDRRADGWNGHGGDRARTGSPCSAVPSPNRSAETGLPGVQITAPGNPLAPPGTAQAPVTAPATGSAPVAPGAAPAPATPPGAATRPPVPIPPPAPSRMIQTEPLIQSGPLAGLTANQAREAQAAGISGVPTAELAQRMEAWRQQNITNRQTAATANVAQQQADLARQQWLYEQQVKAATTANYQWDPKQGAYIDTSGTHPPVTPPSPRMTVTPEGDVIQAMPGGGVRVVSRLADPADHRRRLPLATGARHRRGGRRLPSCLPALVEQGRDATQAIGNIDYGMSQLAKAQQGGINTGYFSGALTNVQSALKSLGVPTDKIPFINVDPSAIGNIQTAQKTLAIVSSAILKQALGDSQITDAKIQHFIHAQPGIETDPQALSRVLNWARSQFVYENEQSKAAVTQAASSPTGTLPLNWQAQYYRDHGFAPIYDRGSGEMQQPDGAAPGREPPPGPLATAPVNPSSRTANTTYLTPKGPLKWTGTGWVSP